MVKAGGLEVSTGRIGFITINTFSYGYSTSSITHKQVEF